MSAGYVDRIARQSVSGWAADPGRPDDAVDIVVIVNGAKVAQVTCDAARSDLERLGAYGNGRHGFRHEFAPHLPDDRNLRVGVRFADSGRPVPNGDAVIPAGAAATPAPPPRPFAAAAPREAGSLFRLLGLYEDEWGLYEWSCRLDFTGIRPAHLDYAVLGETGAEIRRPGPWDRSAARDHLNELLRSPRFQRDIVAHVLRAFPEKQRMIFVHIPKCAGTDLLFHLGTRFPLVRPNWAEEGWTERPALFRALAELAREVPFCGSLMAGGHLGLDYYVDSGLIRPTDRVFTVIRDPIEVAISQVNYVISRFHANIGAHHIEPDVRGWMSMLGIPALPPQMAPPFINEISHRAMYHTEIVAPNSLCHWLGGGDAGAVIGRLADHHVEITNTTHYADWLRDAWGITTKTRMNASTKYLALAGLSHQDLAHVQNLSPEDRKLYDLISERLAASGRSSIFGEDLL